MITPENAPPGSTVVAIVDSVNVRAGARYIIDRWTNGRVWTVRSDGQWVPGHFPDEFDPPPAPTVYKKEGKPDYTYVCRDMLDPLVRVLEKGGTKHGRENYLTNPAVTDNEIIAALRRHALEDPLSLDDGPGGTGETHGACVMANAAMLAHRTARRLKGA